MNLKLCVSIVLVFLLSACGGHGYEGKYTLKMEEGPMSELLRSTGKGHLLEEKIIEIGTDYQYGDGQRAEYENVFVREKSNAKELVFILKIDNGTQEIAYTIVDDNTLRLDAGNNMIFMYKRI